MCVRTFVYRCQSEILIDFRIKVVDNIFLNFKTILKVRQSPDIQYKLTISFQGTKDQTWLKKLSTSFRSFITL